MVATTPRGFSLVEMLVVLAIITVVTVIAITGQQTFNRSLLLADTAYTVAFSVREAQSLGLSSRTFGSVQDAGYGIRFSRSTPGSYLLYADSITTNPGNTQGGLCPGHTVSSGPEARPGNCVYDGTSELVRTYTFSRGFTVASFCGTTTTGTTVCSTDGTPVDHLDVTFMRPSTDSVIMATRGSTLIKLNDAYLRVRSADGVSERCVTVSKVGQIAVINSCP